MRAEFEQLWAKRSLYVRTVRRLIQLSGIALDALPTPTIDDLVAEVCCDDNINACLKKMRLDAAAGPDNQHGYAVRRAGDAIRALVRYIITAIMLADELDPAETLGRLALIAKPGRDAADPRSGYRPIVVINHVQGLIERVLQRHYSKHAAAIRSSCQGGYLANCTVVALLWVTRSAAELAMIRRETRGEASSDAKSFFDNVQLELLAELEAACGIAPEATRRVHKITASTRLSVNTAGGTVNDISVGAGLGQGRFVAVQGALMVTAIRERFANIYTAGEVFYGRNGNVMQHATKALADDESASQSGPLTPQLLALNQEATVLAGDLICGVPTNPAKSHVTLTRWDERGEVTYCYDETIVLPNGERRAPAPMWASASDNKIVGIKYLNTISHDLTDKKRSACVIAFNKKVTNRGGGLLFRERIAMRRINIEGVDYYYCRVTVADIARSRRIDALAVSDDVAEGFIHRTTPPAVLYGPSDAFGLDLPMDEANARAALVDDLMRTANLGCHVPWKSACMSSLSHHLFLKGSNHGDPIGDGDFQIDERAAALLTIEAALHTLKCAGMRLRSSDAEGAHAMGLGARANEPDWLRDGVYLWEKGKPKQTQITFSQRLCSMGVRSTLDLSVIVDIDRSSSPPCAVLADAAQAERIFGGEGTGGGALLFSPSDRLAWRTLTREVWADRTTAGNLQDYARRHQRAPAEVSRALAVGGPLGHRPTVVVCARRPLPAGSARTRQRDAATAAPMYLVRSTANINCGSEGQWLTGWQVVARCSTAAAELAAHLATARLSLSLDSTPAPADGGDASLWAPTTARLDAITVNAAPLIAELSARRPAVIPAPAADATAAPLVAALDAALIVAACRAMKSARLLHEIPEDFYNYAAQRIGSERGVEGNCWQQLGAAPLDDNADELERHDELAGRILNLFTADDYCAAKSYPRSAAGNSGKTSKERDVRKHNAPEYQTYLVGKPDDDNKLHMSAEPSKSDLEGGLQTYGNHKSQLELEEAEAAASRARGRVPLRDLISADPTRFYAADNGDVADPYVINDDILAHPIANCFIRDAHLEPMPVLIDEEGETTGGAAELGAAVMQPTSTAEDLDFKGADFYAKMSADELEGVCPAACKKLAWILATIDIVYPIDMVRSTDGALFPHPLLRRVARAVGWGFARGVARPGSPFYGLPRYVGGALSPAATIARAELCAIIFALLDLEALVDAEGGGKVLVICMDSKGCADNVEKALRAEDVEWLPSCSDATLVETFNSLRLDLMAKGCKIIIVKVPGHARPEYGIGAVSTQAAVDAVAKAAAWRDVIIEPPIRVRRGPMYLVATHDEGRPELTAPPVYSVTSTGTRIAATVARRLRERRAYDALVAADAGRDASHDRCAIDRVIVGTERLPKGLHREMRVWGCEDEGGVAAATGQPAGATADASAASPAPPPKPWLGLRRWMARGHDVSGWPSGRTCGFGWMGQAIGGTPITYCLQRCPCGGRPDVRHVVCGECPYFTLPLAVRAQLRSWLAYLAAEEAKLGYVPTNEANACAADVERAAMTLFGGGTPPPRDARGNARYMHAVRVLAGGWIYPGRAAIRAMKERAEYRSVAEEGAAPWRPAPAPSSKPTPQAPPPPPPRTASAPPAQTTTPRSDSNAYPALRTFRSTAAPTVALLKRDADGRVGLAVDSHGKITAVHSTCAAKGKLQAGDWIVRVGSRHVRIPFASCLPPPSTLSFRIHVIRPPAASAATPAVDHDYQATCADNLPTPAEWAAATLPYSAKAMRPPPIERHHGAIGYGDDNDNGDRSGGADDDLDDFDVEEEAYYNHYMKHEGESLVRREIARWLRRIWSVLAVWMNAYEDVLLRLHAALVDIHGSGHDELDAAQTYAPTVRDGGATGALADQRAAAVEAIKQVRGAAKATRARLNSVQDDYQMSAYSQRRFRGPTQLDALASDALTYAHAEGTDGLANEQNCEAALRALSYAGDPYAGEQLSTLATDVRHNEPVAFELPPHSLPVRGLDPDEERDARVSPKHAFANEARLQRTANDGDSSDDEDGVLENYKVTCELCSRVFNSIAGSCPGQGGKTCIWSLPRRCQQDGCSALLTYDQVDCAVCKRESIHRGSWDVRLRLEYGDRAVAWLGSADTPAARTAKANADFVAAAEAAARPAGCACYFEYVRSAANVADLPSRVDLSGVEWDCGLPGEGLRSVPVEAVLPERRDWADAVADRVLRVRRL